MRTSSYAVTGFRTIFCAFLFILLAGVSAWSQEAVSIRFQSSKPDGDLEDVLYLSMGVELLKKGFSTTRLTEGTRFNLTVFYTSGSNAAELRLELAKTGLLTGTTATGPFMLPFDSSFDSVLADELGKLLDEANLKGTDEGAIKIEGLLAEKPQQNSERLRTNKTRRPVVSFSPGAILFVGESAERLSFAAGGALRAGFIFLRKQTSWSAGLRFSAAPAQKATGVQGGDVYLGTLGVDGEYGIGTRYPFKLSGVASAGTSFIALAKDGATLVKTVPYADAGVLAAFPLGKDFFAGADIRFLCIFDSDILITGVNPSLSIVKEY